MPKSRNKALDFISFWFIKHSPSGKTEIWEIRSKPKPVMLLGEIKWYSYWRRYAFYPSPGTIWDRDCLRLVNDKLAELNTAHFKRNSGNP